MSATSRRRAASAMKAGSVSSCGRKPAWNVTSCIPSRFAMGTVAAMLALFCSHVASGAMPPVTRMVSIVV